MQTQLRNKETERLTLSEGFGQRLTKTITIYQNRIALVPANQQKYVALVASRNWRRRITRNFSGRKPPPPRFEDVVSARPARIWKFWIPPRCRKRRRRPNRWLITGIGVGMGLVAGIFLTGIKEVKDTSLKNLKDVRAYTNFRFSAAFRCSRTICWCAASGAWPMSAGRRQSF